MYKHFFKRLFDFFIALIALLLIGWFILLVALFLHFANKGAGAFFTQDRPGKDGKMFRLIKFKTMTDERGENGRLLPDSQRLTKVGRFVRSTSIDELPQLINILKGDMALIGPRPLLDQYLWVMGDFQKRRMEVRPGITGWAQVHGRNHLKLSKKFELDVWYVDHCSLWLDIKIVWMTIINVLKRSDVGEGNSDMKDIDDLGYLPRILEILNNQQQQKQQQDA
jgi:lipopolysaccharide/colanic/teichoic acid biosynthesis glycosyltransferase